MNLLGKCMKRCEMLIGLQWIVKIIISDKYF